MVVIVICVALVSLGVAIVVRRGAPQEEQPIGWFRYAAGSLAAGLVAGVLAATAGGRLVMRVLGATSTEVEGSFTEAGERVGEISLGGTVELMIFGGLPAGVLSGALYALVGPLLPRGYGRGIALGVLLLVLAGTTVDPLRADNVDFLLLEPAWLAVIGFSAVALLHGMLVAALGPVKTVPASRIVTAGRIGLAIVLLAALPGFAAALSDILSA